MTKKTIIEQLISGTEIKIIPNSIKTDDGLYAITVNVYLKDDIIFTLRRVDDNEDVAINEMYEVILLLALSNLSKISNMKYER